jgi:XTP/dITP diphosphohydrolase
LRFALASANPGKLRELRRLLPDWEIDPVDTTGIGEETGSTFYENARAKARFARSRAQGGWAIGEDSGLEVNGLGGAPGIRSARYAGEGSTDEANVEKLLADLEAMSGESRRARYVCVLVAVAPGGAEVRGLGTLAGRIARERAGTGGFGYDPVFIPEGESTTVGVLGDEWKASRSHRAEAARALARAVRSIETGGSRSGW